MPCLRMSRNRSLQYVFITLILFVCVGILISIDFEVIGDNKVWTRPLVNRIEQLHKPKDKEPIVYYHNRCQCKKYILNTGQTFLEEYPEYRRVSTCSDEADFYGPGQKVVSFSLYGLTRLKTKYNTGIWQNIVGMRTYYPGWVMRIYSNFRIKPRDEYCDIVCTNTDVFWCDVNDLPALGNMSRMFGMTWRFLPIGDPFVDIFVSRDIDSRLGGRDGRAVEDWVKSEKLIHVMRDHYSHVNFALLGGMWGMRVGYLELEDARVIQRKIIKKSKKEKEYGFDQRLLANMFYTPKYHKEILAHGMEFCQTFFETLCHPYPNFMIRRDNGYLMEEMVGRIHEPAGSSD